ncbi:MAG TPA: shikimate dehydrogenase [Bacteroidia bacterium]|jgi:shikimate dehydrogenase|nr:shikimate dehydrogenase [Bacteroidia bacterium]
MATDAHKKICLVIGDHVGRSLSPAMHNAAYKALGIDSQYEFKLMRIAATELKQGIKEIRANGIHAFAVTIPHKEAIMQYLNEINDEARHIGAVNTVLNVNGKLIGYNTDYYGAMESLKQHVSLSNKKVAVLGSGGSARAIVYGLTKGKCSVIIYSRNTEKADELAESFGCKVKSWEQRNNLQADIIINTTPIGKEGEALPIDESIIQKEQIVFDVNYSVNGTSLAHAAERKGAVNVDGLEMLLRQGMMQFELYTGLKAPEQAMRNALKNELNHVTTI